MRNHLDVTDEPMLIIDQGNASVMSHGLEWRRTKFHPILGMDPNRSTELGKVRILPQNTFASERLARESSTEWIQIEALSWEKWEFFRKIPLLQNVRPGNVGNFVLEDPVTLTFDGCWFIIQINDISMKLYHVPIWHSSCYKNSTSQSVSQCWQCIVHAQIRGSDGHKSVMQCGGWLSNIKITRDLVARNINISFCQHDQTSRNHGGKYLG